MLLYQLNYVQALCFYSSEFKRFVLVQCKFVSEVCGLLTLYRIIFFPFTKRIEVVEKNEKTR